MAEVSESRQLLSVDPPDLKAVLNPGCYCFIAFHSKESDHKGERVQEESTSDNIMMAPKAEKRPGTAVEFIEHVSELSVDEEQNTEGYHYHSTTSVNASSTPTVPSQEELLASLILAWPLPKPTEDYCLTENATVPLLLYTLSRSAYEQPPRDVETGKRPREKIVKKIQRSWQKSIQQAEDIKRGDYPHPSLIKRIIGTSFWIDVLYSKTSFNSDHMASPQETTTATLCDETAKISFKKALSQARKQAKIRAIISVCFLPVALAAEIYAPLVFEIALVYFVIQWRSWMKAKFLVERNNDQVNLPMPNPNSLETGNGVEAKSLGGKVELKAAESETFHKIDELVYRCCFEVDPLKFPCLIKNTLLLEAIASQGAMIESASTCQRSDSIKNIKQLSAREGKVDIVKLPIVTNTDIPPPAMTTFNYDGVDITTRDSNQDNRAGLCLEERATHATQPAEFALNHNPGEALPNCDLATPDSSHPKSKSDLSTPLSSCVTHAMPRKSIESKDIATVFVTDVGMDANSTREIAQQTAPSINETNQQKAVPNIDIAIALIDIFKSHLPSQVYARHELNERRIAEDFNRVLKRRTREYVKSIKKKKNK
ncbi:hypothetical protein PCASD_20969 [Puccinia coronata f. sp. avenae]|uniref:Uncharacterized protein n=1 Tax=Puccinia coronata f. sp. avenae TaxID=200324 RepID=A0A2N5SIF7_9BASI|nr:hypothetical protein PCASD_20969 [Puccinia coronata f. sp. avenae]